MGKPSKRKRIDYGPYWHGGVAGLETGLDLLPASQVAPPEYRSTMQQRIGASYDPNWVYFSNNQDVAFDFGVDTACLLGSGALYRVLPIGKPHIDPDYYHPPGLGMRARRARILEVVVASLFSTTPRTNVSMRYALWDDGTPIYDDELMPRPHRTAQALGISRSDLRHLGSAANPSEIISAIDALARQRNPGITQADIDRVRLDYGIRIKKH